MNDHDIEQRLRAIGDATRPRGSITRSVMERIDGVEMPHSVTFRNTFISSLRTWAAAAVVILAASVAAVMAWRAFRAAGPLHVAPPPILAREEGGIPTVADYRRAYMKSSDQFDALLRQAPATGTPEPVVRAADVSRPELNL